MSNLDELFEKKTGKKSFSDLNKEIGLLKWQPKAARTPRDNGPNIDGVNDPLNASIDQDTSMLDKEVKTGRYGKEPVNPYTMFAGRKNIYKDGLDEAFETSAPEPPSARNKPDKPKKGKDGLPFELYKTKNKDAGPQGDEADFAMSGAGLGPNNFKANYESAEIAEGIISRVRAKYK